MSETGALGSAADGAHHHEKIFRVEAICWIVEPPVIWSCARPTFGVESARRGWETIAEIARHCHFLRP